MKKTAAMLALTALFATPAVAEQLSGQVIYNSKDSRVLGLNTAAGMTALAYGPDMQFSGVAAIDGVKACDEIEVEAVVKGQTKEIRNIRLSRKGDPASCQIPPAVIVPVSDLYRALLDKSAVVVDVRTPEEFAKAHFDGAVSIPLPELAARSVELPKDKPVILYCATARRSALAAAILRVNGINATYVKGKFSVNDGKPQIIE
jgi:rhodanese-related sulfurtransferase